VFPDISEHQGAVDWNALGAAYQAGQIEAVAIRASFGTARADLQFFTNQRECRARGIPAIYYHFCYPTFNSPQAEAAFFNSIVGRPQPNEAMVGDFEDDGANLFPRGQAGVDWARAFLEAVEAPQSASWWYTYPYLLTVVPLQQLYGVWPFWLADYSATPDSAFSQAITRQFTNCGSTPGVTGCCDQSRVLKPPLTEWLAGSAQAVNYWQEDYMDFDGTWNGNQNLFRIEPNGALVHSWTTGNGIWQNEALGIGYVPGAMTLSRAADGSQLHVFALKPDGGVGHFWQNRGQTTWSVEQIAAA
jgi:GH25 family lysozyme M1 (1,4-beta-N-acetylmuramidase)